MPSSPQRLANGQLGTSSGALYTADAKVTITAATMNNPTGSNRTFGLWIVPASSSASDSNSAQTDESILAKQNKSADALIGQVLYSGDAIHGIANGANAVTYIISGMVHS